MQRSFTFGGYETTVTMTGRDRLWDSLDDRACLVADANTAAFLPEDRRFHEVPVGERAKSWSELERLLAGLLDADLTRDASIVGVGGGVVCDLTALAANLYLRGCRLVLVPTTLLAMVDASLGGKTGINFGGFKNIVGTFYPASEIRICPQTLTTLPEREYRSGLAEVIKTAMLGDADLFGTLEGEPDRVAARDAALLEGAVWSCLEIKGSIVEADLTETGVRAHLNLGHTFAHALESVEGLGAWSHGEAVAWGLARAMELGSAAGITDAAYARRVRELLLRYGYRVGPLPEAAQQIRAAMQKDKKRRGNRLRFVLQKRLGETIVTEVDSALVDRVLGGEAGEGGGDG